MDIKEILSKVDHTVLSVTARWEDIRMLCDEGLSYHTASVCIPPLYVAKAKAYVGDRLKICTVIGFPNGYATTASKVFETADAVKNGADEIDMVIPIGYVKDRRFDEILEEINAVKKACDGRLLKVIVETCLLTDEEKDILCDMVSKSGAEYIKTSTGFSTGGATFADVKRMVERVSNGTLVKAAGGIGGIEDAETFLELGASRLGTSRVIKAVKEQNA